MVDQSLPAGFLWGAATSAHQTEGDNTCSDWWALEQQGLPFIQEPSGHACDSWHRWPQDMDLLVDAGFSDYRFSIEWARVEPEPGAVSEAALTHYADMVRGAQARGLRPMVTLHHFTSPRWFHERGGWTAPDAVARFRRYVETVAPLLDGVRHVCTINEPNVLAVLPLLLAGDGAFGDRGLPVPHPATADALLQAHRAARASLRDLAPHVRVGWSVACQAFEPLPCAEQLCAQHAWPRETRFLEAARDDDWVGVQSYTRTRVGPEGPVPPPADAPRTLTGWEVFPEALGAAVRTAWDVARVPVIVTENGIATDDDAVRRSYTAAALQSLRTAMADGVDVRGYFHWSLLDNYEWGRWSPTFGLVAVDRTTFARTPKPSLRWLGARGPARTNEESSVAP